MAVKAYECWHGTGYEARVRLADGREIARRFPPNRDHGPNIGATRAAERWEREQITAVHSQLSQATLSGPARRGRRSCGRTHSCSNHSHH